MNLVSLASDDSATCRCLVSVISASAGINLRVVTGRFAKPFDQAVLPPELHRHLAPPPGA